MKLDQIRIYAEVLEQGLDIKEYISTIYQQVEILNIYTKKTRSEIFDCDSLVDKIRKSKDIDILITVISESQEFPLLMIEYSTAVPTDDHKMQRSDVYFWSGIFKVPVLKIYPSVKGMEQKFGGGDKFTDELEKYLAYSKDAILITLPWENITGTYLLDTNADSPSCINKSDELTKIFNNLFEFFEKSKSFDDYYKFLLEFYKENYKKIIENYTKMNLSDIITQSSRFTLTNNTIMSKINRFGHAMDPERGVLYFINMLVGYQNSISEIQINRVSDINARGGYSSLFDAISREDELIAYVKHIIENNNNEFTEENALFIFKRALNIDNKLEFIKISPRNYVIDDEVLQNFLLNTNGMTAKSIFFLSKELHLTDKNRELILKVSWGINPVNAFMSRFKGKVFKPTDINPIAIDSVQEDLVTYASVQLYKKLKFKILSVSYPGAQGDRAILVGEGRNVIRIYIDIIAYTENSKTDFVVYLQESKDVLSKSKSDVEKLVDIKNNPLKIEGLKTLFKRVTNNSEFEKVYTSLGSKQSNNIPAYDVDYILMFSVEKGYNNCTNVIWQIALINTELLNVFNKLQNNENRLRGILKLDGLYTIK